MRTNLMLQNLIITGRGGGSIEDLWAFNDERVARAIFESRIPVISAVGHEPDVTISDYVADRRASTPSNAAEIAVPDRREVIDAIASYEIRSTQAIQKKVGQLSDRLNVYRNKHVLTVPTAYIDNKRMELDRIRDRLISAQEQNINFNRNKFIALTAALDAMSPLKVLMRGYAIASKESGKSIKSVNELSAGDRLELSLSDGTAHCTVDSIQKK